jgi:2-(1,2-epoxy-1,2-dihydrophenyl)acetyl-CoA isomerase
VDKQPNYETISVEIDDCICRVRLARPDRLNSFNALMMTELKTAFRSISSNSDLRLVVVCGEGRAFCTGQDLEERRIPEGQPKPDLGDSLRSNYNQLMLTIRNLSIPVVAVVNGVAAGAGASFALGCDIVVAKSTARFLYPFTALGLVPDAGSTANLPRSLGQARAMGLALLGEEISAEEAARCGLIWAAVSEEDLDDYVSAIEDRLVARPALGLALTKRAIYRAFDQDYEHQLRTESECQSIAGRNPIYWEKVLQFLNKGKS